MAASGVSSEMPAPPCTWMARSMTFVAARGQATLAIETRCLAALLPCASITAQAFWHSSRAWSISSRDSATCCWSMPWSASGPPNATRELARATIIASARSAAPSARMQWWIRPGPSRAWAAANPPPSSPSTLATGTRTPSNRTSACPCWSCRPITGRSRTIVTPGVSTGTSTIDCCRYGAASGSVLPIAIRSRQRGSSAPEVHHFRPVMTYSSPSRSILVVMLVASEEATSGSVIANPDRIVPASSGSSHCCFCAGVPIRCSSSMLPVSGAAQLIASGAISRLQPDSSAIGAYSSWVRPDTSGRNRFHSSRRRASALSSSTTGGTEWSSGPAFAR